MAQHRTADIIEDGLKVARRRLAFLALSDLGERQEPVVDAGGEDRLEQVALVPIAAVEGRLADASRLGHRIHARSLVSVLHEKPGRSVEQADVPKRRLFPRGAAAAPDGGPTIIILACHATTPCAKALRDII